MLVEMVSFIAKIVSALKPKRRWFQFSLKWLFVLIALVAVPCAWLAWKLEHKRRERAAVAEFERIGASVIYDWFYRHTDSPPGPAWARRLLGYDFFAEVDTIYVRPGGLGPAMAHLGALRQLKELHFAGTVNNSSLVYVEGLQNLEILSLAGTRVTDAGLFHLRGLTRLEELYLDDTAVTGTGFIYLKGLKRLKGLTLGGTMVTGAGLVDLGNLEQLNLTDTLVNDDLVSHLVGLTKITDAGLDHLKALTNLEGLDLTATRVTDAGMVQLAKFANLRRLFLRGTHVTAVGIAEIRQALPMDELLHDREMNDEP